MTEDDPLWNPRATPDPELAELCATLAAYSVRARGISGWSVPAAAVPVRKHGVRRIVALAAAAALLLAIGLHLHRLQWADGQSWAVHAVAQASTVRALGEGQRIVTGNADAVSIEVARIGRIELSPGSALRLVETRTAHHRVDLEHGHLRARIWAPPGYFGLSDGRSEIVDLGCDFEVWKDGDGSARVRVLSGWIAWRGDAGERLVPAGHEVHIDHGRVSTPLREEAPADLRAAVVVLDALLSGDAGRDERIDAAAARVAAVASDADRVTLLSLLLERPALASGPLYPRAAAAFDMPLDPAQRRALAAGNRAAVDAWWMRLPAQPKHWWMNWRDVL